MKKPPSQKTLYWLKDELDIWKQNGMISEEQAQKITETYSLTQIEEKGIPSRLIIAVSIMGAILIGAGVILLIASNWQALSKSVKLLIILGTILSVYHLGYDLRYTRGNYPKIGSALIFLGSLLFGGGIWLVAQIYHITSRFHSGVLFWALGILPIAWLLGLQPILAISSGLLSFWAVWKCIDFQIANYTYLILMLGIIFPLSYKLRTKLVLFLSVMGVVIWFGVGPLSISVKNRELLLIICYLLLGILLYSIGLLHSINDNLSSYGSIYKFIGSVILFGFAYLMSFKGIVRHIRKDIRIPVDFWWILGIISVLTLLAIVISFMMNQKKAPYFKNIIKIEMVSLIVFWLFQMFLILFPNTIFYGVSSNLILLMLSIGFIFLGYYQHQSFFVNLGFLFFVIHFLTRYIDWGWRYLPRSAFFVVAGIILLLGAALMERKRRKLIEAIKEKA